MLAAVQRIHRRIAVALVFGLGFLAAVATNASPCAAQVKDSQASAPPTTLQLDAHTCPDAWAGELEHFVRIELGAARNDGGTETPAPPHVRVRCDADLADIEVTHAVTRRSTQRRMDLSATAESVRARVVALAIAGLVRELSLIARETQASQDAPAPAPVTAVTPPPALETDPPAADSFELDALLIAGTFSAWDDVLWGGGLRLRYLALAPFSIALDLEAGMYSRRAELGTARLVAASLGARFGWMFAWRDLGFTSGLGQRVGLASATATTDRDAETGSAFGLWAAPLAFAAFDVAVAGRYRLGLDAEVGAVLLPVHGRIEGGDDIDVDGLWLSLSASIGVRF